MSVTVAGRSLPLELVVVAALYALGGLYLLIETLRALPDLGDALSALFSDDAFGFFFGWVILMVLAILVYVTGLLVATAWFLFRLEPVGRGLAAVIFATLFLLVAFGEEVPGEIVAVLVATGLALAVLFGSPHVRAAFASSPSLGGRPTPVVLAQTLLLVSFSLLALLAVLFLPGLRFAGELGARFIFWFVLEVAATAGGLLAYRRLKNPDRTARLLATAACAVAFVGGFLLPDVGTNLISAALAWYATIVAALWLPPAARAWFGDEPVRLATPGTSGPSPPTAHP